MSYQSIIALENFLDWEFIKNSFGNLLRNEELMSFIKEKSKSTDGCLSKCAKRVPGKLFGMKQI